MLFNQNDPYTGASYEAYGEWKELELSLLRAIVKPGMTVLDIGANIGQHSVVFAKIVGLQGSVFAFEPQRLFFQTLCANVALNQQVKVHARQVAVGSENGQISVPVMSPWLEKFNYAALNLKAPQIDAACEMVDMITVDSLHLQQCDMMKIEVVGMEADVIRGAYQTLQRCRPILYVENDLIGITDSTGSEQKKIKENNRTRRMNLIHLLDDYGYTMYWHVAPYFHSDNFFHNKTNIFNNAAATNMLCIPKESKHSVTGITPIDPRSPHCDAL